MRMVLSHEMIRPGHGDETTMQVLLRGKDCNQRGTTQILPYVFADTLPFVIRFVENPFLYSLHCTVLYILIAV